MMHPDKIDPYGVACTKCGSAPGDACFMVRPPWDVCQWPHRERVQTAASAAAAWEEKEIL